jgi:hypothetical protein
MSFKAKIVDSKTQEPIWTARVEIIDHVTTSDMSGDVVIPDTYNDMDIKISYPGYITKLSRLIKDETQLIELEPEVKK